MANENFNPTLSTDEVWMGTDSSACLTDYIGIENKTYPGCYYRTVDGVTEWINPPMVVGEEYRTTKRHNGKPIYTKLIDFGVLSNYSVNVGARNIISMVGLTTSFDGNNVYHDTFPVINTNDLAILAVAHHGNNSIYVKLNADYPATANYTAQFTIEYTKD